MKSKPKSQSWSRTFYLWLRNPVLQLLMRVEAFSHSTSHAKRPTCHCCKKTEKSHRHRKTTKGTLAPFLYFPYTPGQNSNCVKQRIWNL